MTLMLFLSLVACALAALPAALFCANLVLFRRLPAAATGRPAAVSILVPARDEAAGIRACVEAALASEGVELEVIVLDDHSRDGTAGVVRELAARDPRLRLEAAPPLPSGWCGKQHACHVLAARASHDLLLFIDADVHLSPDAAARAAAFVRHTGAALVSGFPRQETASLLERMLIPLIHVILLGYLPVYVMRRRPTDPAFAAGCGQFMLARRDAYGRVGGHGAIRASLHDGITLPRAFRARGFATDIFDATDTAACRMYHGNRACWRGLGKNATEGMASPRAIGLWTALLLGGHVLPPVLLGILVTTGPHVTTAAALAGAATAGVLTMRLAAAARFRQRVPGALLHPFAVLVLVTLQWEALLRRLAGRPTTWKGRAYANAGAK